MFQAVTQTRLRDGGTISTVILPVIQHLMNRSNNLLKSVTKKGDLTEILISTTPSKASLGSKVT